MRIVKIIVVLLIIGALQTGLAHGLDLHRGLLHMQYHHWWEYAFESLFYSFWWWFIGMASGILDTKDLDKLTGLK